MPLQPNFRLMAVVAFVACLICLLSCTKEPLSPTPLPVVTMGTGVKTNNIILPLFCQLTSISDNANYSWRQGILNKIDYTNIVYNADGLPARCKHSESQNDSVTSNFYYDVSKRLKSIITNWYPQSHVFAAYKTEYSTFNYLANGSLLVGQYTLAGGNPVKQGVGALLILFDASHRVVKQTRTLGATDGTGTVSGYLRYAYGADGNLSNVYMWEAGVTGGTEMLYYHFNAYDTKRNFCTTNSVWQLLLDQYSVNNPINLADAWGNNDLMAYEYSAQNEPTLVYHWDAADHYWTTEPIGYSCRLIF